MKFNMGCGFNTMDGYVNVDRQPASKADEIWDLEVTPWPWPSDCAEQVWFTHSLEHMGQDPKVFLSMMKELYRICAPDARVVIIVPHHRSDSFLADPTHVRPILGDTLRLFDRKLNEKWIGEHAANTPFAIYLDVDFEMVADDIILDQHYQGLLEQRKLSGAKISKLVRESANVAAEYRCILRVRKTAAEGLAAST